MKTAFWFTVQVGRRRVSLPLLILLPLTPLLDALVVVGLTVYSIRARSASPTRVGATLPLTRLVVTLLLYGGGLNIRVRDYGQDEVRLFGGWQRR